MALLCKADPARGRMRVGNEAVHPSRRFLLERMGHALVVTQCCGQMLERWAAGS